MKTFLSYVTICLAFLLAPCNAQELSAQVPEKIVEVTKDKVNIRKEAATNGVVLNKAPLGKQYELIGEKGIWFEIKDPLTGETGFVANSVAVAKKPIPMATFLKEMNDKEYEYRITGKEEERINTFSLGKKEKGVMTAFYSSSYANTKGHANTTENSYKGKINDWYILLDKEVDFEENESEISPMPVYRSIVKEGIHIEGIFYKVITPSTF